MGFPVDLGADIEIAPKITEGFGARFGGMLEIAMQSAQGASRFV